jgi:flagellar motor component MotA
MLEGVAGIVEGLNPKLIRTKLEAYLEPTAPKTAKSAKQKAGAAAAAPSPVAPSAPSAAPAGSQ